MFELIVFWLLAMVLFSGSGAAIYMGLFKAGRPGRSYFYKAFSGLCSFAISGAVWFTMYSYHYLGW